MKISLFKLHQYLFSDWADLSKAIPPDLIAKMAAPKKTTTEAKKKEVPTDVEAIKKKLIDKRRKEITEFFFGKKSIETLPDSEKSQLRAALRALGAKHLEEVFFGNITDAITATYTIPDDKEIENRFRQFEEAHGFFRSIEQPYALAAFSTYFKIAKFVGDFIEKNNDEKNDVAFDHAYKMLALFFQDPKNLFKTIDEYLAKFINTENPLHDALVYSLPLRGFDDRFDRPGWQAFIQNFGPSAMKIINNAIVIQQHVEGGKAPKTMDEARELLKKISFKNADRFPELAELCVKYGVGEAIFEKCLKIRFPKEGVELKAHDRLPEVIINGEEVGHPGYCFVKLPKDDPRAFLLGQITACCQSIGGYTEQCVIDSVTLENNGIYVLLKRKPTKSESDAKEIKETKSASPFLEPNKINYSAYDIVGQGYAWFSKDGNLVVDSWENLTPTRDDPVIIPFLEKFAEKITKEPGSPLRVTIGKGGKTPAKWKEKQSVREDILTGFHYIDSHTQAVVFCNEERKKTYIAELETFFNDLFKEEKAALKMNYYFFNSICSTCNSEFAFKEAKDSLSKIDPADLKYFLLLNGELREENTRIKLKNLVEEVAFLHKANLYKYDDIKEAVFRTIRNKDKDLVAPSISRALTILEKASLDTDPYIRKYVLRHPDEVHEIVKKYQFLQNVDLHRDPDLRKMICFKGFQKTREIAIKILEKLDLIHLPELENKMLATKYPEQLASAFIELKKLGLHNEENVQKLIYKAESKCIDSCTVLDNILQIMKDSVNSDLMKDKAIRAKIFKSADTAMSYGGRGALTETHNLIMAYDTLKKAKLEKEEDLRNIILFSSGHYLDGEKMSQAIAAFRAKKSAKSDSKLKEAKSEADLKYEYHFLLISLNDHIHDATAKDSPGFFMHTGDEINAMIALKQAIEKRENITDVREKYYRSLRDAGVLYIADRMNEILSSKENKIGSRPK